MPLSIYDLAGNVHLGSVAVGSVLEVAELEALLRSGSLTHVVEGVGAEADQEG